MKFVCIYYSILNVCFFTGNCWNQCYSQIWFAHIKWAKFLIVILHLVMETHRCFKQLAFLTSLLHKLNWLQPLIGLYCYTIEQMYRFIILNGFRTAFSYAITPASNDLIETDWNRLLCNGIRLKSYRNLQSVCCNSLRMVQGFNKYWMHRASIHQNGLWLIRNAFTDMNLTWL